MRQPIADAHTDLLTELAHRARERNPFGRRWLDGLRRGGVRVQVCPVFTADRPSAELAWRDALLQVEAFERAVRENAPEVRAAATQSALDGDGIALVLALEGAEPLGDRPERIEELWERGVRVVAPTWNRENAFGGGVEAPAAGLSERGRKLVDRVVALGGVVDLAHASARTFDDVLSRVPRGRVLVSHAGCRAVQDRRRNLGDEQLTALAGHEGVVCVTADAELVDPVDPSLARMVDHIEHALAVMGERGVGLGGDFLDQIARSGAIGGSNVRRLLWRARGRRFSVRGLDGPGDYGNLAATLRERGLDDDRRRGVLHDNLTHFLAQALPK